MKSLFGGIASALRNNAPVPFIGKQLRIPVIPPTGSEQHMRSMGSVGTVFSIVNRTSVSTSKACWHLYRKSPTGDPEKRVEVVRHWALDVWNKPNRFMTRQEFVESGQQHLDLTGEMWWVIGRDERAPSIPLTIWPVRPDRMAPVPDANKFISGYEYTGPNGEKIPLGLHEVIFIRMPNPLDPYRGMGPIQSVLADLDAVRYSAEWNRNFFINGAEPGGIIEVDHRLSDEEFNELSDRWDEQHRGVANAHRVAIVEQGRWIDRKFTNRDMQFAEMRDVNSRVIREAFGMPKFAIGDVDDVNRATAEAAKAWFAEELTVPRLERIRGALNNDFLPLFGPAAEGLEFDFDSPVPADREMESKEIVAKSSAAKTLMDSGFEKADVLKVVGLPDMKWTKPEPPPPPVAPGQADSPPAGGGLPGGALAPPRRIGAAGGGGAAPGYTLPHIGYPYYQEQGWPTQDGKEGEIRVIEIGGVVLEIRFTDGMWCVVRTHTPNRPGWTIGPKA